MILLVLFSFLISSLKSQVVDERTGITIHFRVNDETFPENWKTEEINAKGVSLDTLEIKRSLKFINAALDKYPTDILMKNLREVYILKSIEFYGQGFGGTYATDIVYIANDGVDKGYSEDYLEQTFHHEFSSILLYNHEDSFDKEKWKSFNELSYGSGGVQALKDGKDNQSIDPILNVKGFLTQYASSDFEEDFNSFAENIFVPNCEFHMAIKENLKLAEKRKLIIDFYNSFDKTFTQEYFEALLEKECITKNKPH